MQATLNDRARRQLLDHAEGLPRTLHRALDVTPELAKDLEAQTEHVSDLLRTLNELNPRGSPS